MDKKRPLKFTGEARKYRKTISREAWKAKRAERKNRPLNRSRSEPSELLNHTLIICSSGIRLDGAIQRKSAVLGQQTDAKPTDPFRCTQQRQKRS